ncbi:hypothetical protein [Alcanivorax jadensis]|jgi:hypothetical protein|uniref:hypothetical protein n=1 Tax=Alcanivorax jadensis TaxID=64988 RepID=UPI002409BE17|nr:hypothetical protein [Alcanivorax jadensis]MDF1638674.1 hypothetical protein [Alcanivorax jadensis]
MARLLILVSLLCVATGVFAQCIQQDEGRALHARYQVFDGDTSRHVDFYRFQDRVAWRQGEVISVWRKDADSASLLRVFPGHQRSIWYPTGDLRALGKEAQWQTVTGWPQPEKAGFTPVNDSSVVVVQGCKAWQYEKAGQTVLWAEEPALPVRMSDGERRWQLVSLQQVPASETFVRWEQWPSTDFADVGDNEADPFLRKMIALGFVEHGASGFYSAEGEARQGGHHH